MALKHCYQPFKKENWQGRSDAPVDSTFFQIVQQLDLTRISALSTQAMSFALLGFCSDEGIRRNAGRVGAAAGPPALRRVLAKMPVHTTVNVYDVGDIVCVNQDLELAQVALGEAVALLLERDITPIVIGGGHELAFGHYQGIAKTISHERLDIVNCDAHLDMRPLLHNKQGSSGTPFLQIAQARKNADLPFYYHCIGVQKTANTKNLFETAQEYHVNILLAELIHNQPKEFVDNFLNPIVDAAAHIYLSVCLDVFASSVAPGVSAPQAYGLTPSQIVPIVRQLAASGQVISYDIAELSPVLDCDQCTAQLASQLIFDIIHHHNFRGK